MGFPGTSIDGLELVSDDISDQNGIDSAESEDEDEMRSNSKYSIIFYRWNNR